MNFAGCVMKSMNSEKIVERGARVFIAG